MYLVVPPDGSFPETRRIELGPRPLTIGRQDSCDIRVDVPGVDNEHAKISEVALIAIGPDCAIGDVPLEQGSRRLITPGDEIQIGSIVIVLEGEDPNQMISELGRKRPEGPRVRVVEGENFGDELVMKEEGREYVIGRSPKADLVLNDREVSREHIIITRKGYSVFIKDLTSTRGSWLGRAAVYQGSVVEWTRPRMLRVGVSVLSLELPDEVRKAAPAPLASAPMTPPPRTKPGHRIIPEATPSAPVVSGVPIPISVQSLADPTPQPGAQLAYTPAPAIAGGAAAMAPIISGPITASDATKPPKVRRTAWKKQGTTLSRSSGLLLLGLAALAVLGALFVVFSLLE